MEHALATLKEECKPDVPRRGLSRTCKKMQEPNPGLGRQLCSITLFGLPVITMTLRSGSICLAVLYRHFGRGIRRYSAVSFTVSRLGAFRKSGARVAAMPLLDCPADRAMATVTSGLAIPPVRVCDCRWVADQIETTTEPGASRKGFAGAHESTAAWGMLEESSRVRALYAHSKKSRWIGRSKNSSIAC